MSAFLIKLDQDSSKSFPRFDSKNSFFLKLFIDLNFKVLYVWQQIQHDTVLTRSKSFVLYTAFSQNWLAFAKLHKPLFTEYGSVNFPNTNPPTDEDNNAYCEVSVQ